MIITVLIRFVPPLGGTTIISQHIFFDGSKIAIGLLALSPLLLQNC